MRDARSGYDEVAELYAELFSGELDQHHAEKGLLVQVATMAQKLAPLPVADIGCGPGHITEHLGTLGLAAFGIDVSWQMVHLASRANPHLAFSQGDMTAVPVRDGSLAGVLYRHSIIHLPPERLGPALDETARVLIDGGVAYLSFSGADGATDHGGSWDHKAATAYRWDPDTLAAALAQRGLREVSRLVHAGTEASRNVPVLSMVFTKQTAG